MTDILRDIMHVCKMTILCVSPKPRHILLNFSYKTTKDNLISNGATVHNFEANPRGRSWF